MKNCIFVELQDAKTTVNNCGILVINNFDKSYANENKNQHHNKSQIVSIESKIRVKGNDSFEYDKKSRREDKEYNSIDVANLDQRSNQEKKASKSYENRRRKRKIEMYKQQQQTFAKSNTFKTIQQRMLQNEMKKSKEFKSLFESDGIKRDYLVRLKGEKINSRASNADLNLKSKHDVSYSKLSDANSKSNVSFL